MTPWSYPHCIVKFKTLYSTIISRQNRNRIQNFFSLLIRSPGGFETFKKRSNVSRHSKDKPRTITIGILATGTLDNFVSASCNTLLIYKNIIKNCDNRQVTHAGMILHQRRFIVHKDISFKRNSYQQRSLKFCNYRPLLCICSIVFRPWNV